MSQASLDEVRLQLGFRVVQAYGDWYSAHLKILANEKSHETHMRLHEQVKRRMLEGASAQSDLTLAVARLESIVADVSAARAQRDIALARLGQLLGRTVDGESLLRSPAQAREVSSSTRALLDQALAINPAVQKAQAQARVQEAVIGKRGQAQFPVV